MRLIRQIIVWRHKVEKILGLMPMKEIKRLKAQLKLEKLENNRLREILNTTNIPYNVSVKEPSMFATYALKYDYNKGIGYNLKPTQRIF